MQRERNCKEKSINSDQTTVLKDVIYPIYVVIIIPLLVCWLFCKLNKLFRKWRIIGFKPMFSEGNKIKKEKEVFLATQSEIMRSHRFESYPVRIPL